MPVRPEHVPARSCRPWPRATRARSRRTRCGTRRTCRARPGAATSIRRTYLPLLEGRLHRRQGWRPERRWSCWVRPSPTGANVAGRSIDDLTYLQQLYAHQQRRGARATTTRCRPTRVAFRIRPTARRPRPQCSLSGGWNNDDSFFAFTRVGQYHDLMAQQGEGSQEDLVHRVRLLLEPDAAAGLRVLLVIDEAHAGAISWSQAFQMARAPYVAGMIAWNLNYPAGRAADRREVGLRRDSLRLERAAPPTPPWPGCPRAEADTPATGGQPAGHQSGSSSGRS